MAVFLCSCSSCPNTLHRCSRGNGIKLPSVARSPKRCLAFLARGKRACRIRMPKKKGWGAPRGGRPIGGTLRGERAHRPPRQTSAAHRPPRQDRIPFPLLYHPASPTPNLPITRRGSRVTSLSPSRAVSPTQRNKYRRRPTARRRAWMDADNKKTEGSRRKTHV